MPNKNVNKPADDAVTISKEGLLIALGISFLLNIILVIALSFIGFRGSQQNAALQSGTGTTATSGTADTSTQNSEWVAQIPAFEARLKTNPKDVQALIGLGNGYFDQGDFNKAIDYYAQSLKIDPKNPDVITDLGYAYLNNKNIQEAKTQFYKATQVSPNHVKAHYNLAVVLKQLGDTAGAKVEFQKVIKLAPQSSEATEANQAMSGL